MKRLRLSTIPLLLTLSVACATLPNPRYYQLRAEGEAAAAAARLDDTPSLGVREFAVDPPYDQDRIVYRVGGDSSEVGFYAYHRWAAPLGRMLPAVVAAALAGTPGLGRVEPARPGVPYTGRLAGRVLALEEIDVDGTPSVHISLVLRVEDAGGDEIWSRSVAASSEVSTGDVADLVDEINRLLVGELRRAAPELARVLTLRR